MARYGGNTFDENLYDEDLLHAAKIKAASNALAAGTEEEEEDSSTEPVPNVLPADGGLGDTNYESSTEVEVHDSFATDMADPGYYPNGDAETPPEDDMYEITDDTDYFDDPEGKTDEDTDDQLADGLSGDDSKADEDEDEDIEVGEEEEEEEEALEGDTDGDGFISMLEQMLMDKMMEDPNERARLEAGRALAAARAQSGRGQMGMSGGMLAVQSDAMGEAARQAEDLLFKQQMQAGRLGAGMETEERNMLLQAIAVKEDLDLDDDEFTALLEGIGFDVDQIEKIIPGIEEGGVPDLEGDTDGDGYIDDDEQAAIDLKEKNDELQRLAEEYYEDAEDMGMSEDQARRYRGHGHGVDEDTNGDYYWAGRAWGLTQEGWEDGLVLAEGHSPPNGGEYETTMTGAREEIYIQGAYFYQVVFGEEQGYDPPLIYYEYVRAATPDEIESFN